MDCVYIFVIITVATNQVGVIEPPNGKFHLFNDRVYPNFCRAQAFLLTFFLLDVEMGAVVVMR